MVMWAGLPSKSKVGEDGGVPTSQSPPMAVATRLPAKKAMEEPAEATSAIEIASHPKLKA